MEDSREGKRDGEKELCTPSPHVGDKKDKRAIVYKTKKKEEKGIGLEKKDHQGMSEATGGEKTMLVALVDLH